jgi:hypothetical protein
MQHPTTEQRIARGKEARAVFDRALGEFASSYSDQNEVDYQKLLNAIAAGRGSP